MYSRSGSRQNDAELQSSKAEAVEHPAPAVTRRQSVVQAKLSVGPADDVYEREADAVADRVMRSLAAPPVMSFDVVSAGADGSRIRRSALPVSNITKIVAGAGAGRIRRFATVGVDGGELDADTDAAISASLGGGTAMGQDVRRKMEGAFGADFGGVRIHEGSEASELNNRIQAKAFTVGNDIYFRDGAPDASSRDGQHLLAHELTHTLQQGGGVQRSTGKIQRRTDIVQRNGDAQAAGGPDDRGRIATQPQATAAVAPSTVQPPSIDEMVAAVLAPDADAKFRKSLVLVCMKKEGFASALAKEPEGRKLLESMVDGSVARWVPDPMAAMNILGPLANTPVQAVAGFFLGLPIGLTFGALSAVQKGIAAAWSGVASDHSQFIRELMKAEFDLEVNDKWSEVALRKTYHAFHQVPDGTVRLCVDALSRVTSFGSSAKLVEGGKVEIKMSNLLPTSLSMGGLEPLERFVTLKFLKGGSDYSRRMRSKNAWTMTTLHEVGHAVDYKRDVMSRFGDQPAFGGWKSPGEMAPDVASAIIDAYTDKPELQPTANEQADIAKEKQLQAEQATIWNDPTADFKKAKEPAKDKIAESKRQEKEINDRVESRAWTEKFAVSKAALQLGVVGAIQGKDPGASAAKAPDFPKGKSEEKWAKKKVKAHPTVAMGKNRTGGMKGAWSRSDSDMEKMSRDFGGRYFHMSYPSAKNDVDKTGTWVSFQVASRKDAVSHYQYRAPGEWFAELYAHYYMGTLKGHPLYDWFEKTIDVTLSPDNLANVDGPNEDDESDAL
ncbi:MAG: DUF4157 domain-containing protein [Actinobacteria bacterium]|nr:DUF4157 domain-containing protein [Actinomycetota bacterium]